jgi:hypothetical protein
MKRKKKIKIVFVNKDKRFKKMHEALMKELNKRL